MQYQVLTSCAGPTFSYYESQIVTVGVNITGAVAADLRTAGHIVPMGNCMLPGLPNVTAVGNVTTGEDDLMSYSLPAYTLAANGDTVVFEGVWLAANTASEKVTKSYFNAISTWVQFSHYNLGASAACRAYFKTVITRLTSSTAMFTTTVGSNQGNEYQTDGLVVSSLDFGTALVFKTTGEATATDDIVQKTLLGWFYPAQ